MSSNPQELLFTAPYSLSDFSAANGAGSIAVDSKITALIVFREELFIFAEERIYKLSGNTVSDFVMTPVTREMVVRTVQLYRNLQVIFFSLDLMGYVV